METEDKTLIRTTFERTLEEAEEVLAGETAEHPSYPDLRNRLGLLLFFKGEEGRGREQFERAISVNPDYLSALSNLAHCHLRSGDLKSASRWFQREIDIFPFASKGYLDMWNFFQTTGKFEEAEKVAMKGEELSPGDPFAPYLRLRTAVKRKRMKDVDELISRLEQMAHGNKIFPFLDAGFSLEEIDTNSNLFELFEYLAFLSAKNGRIAEAREWLIEAQKVRPRLGEHMLALALLSEVSGDEDGTLTYKKKAAALSPASPECWSSLAFEYSKRALPDKALIAFVRALELAPNYADLQFNCGLVYLEERNLEKAVGRFREALHINPGYTFARNSLASTLAKLGRVDEALEEYEKTMRAGLESPDVWVSTARLHLKKGNSSDAIMFLKMAAEDKTGYPHASALLARTYGKLGDMELEREWRRKFMSARKGKSSVTTVDTK
ncbi:MAG: tetratricopeptide repeat protein [Candidatus Eisenbacteria bacterium]|nr:tetratricopeptide repeat protein [Candidatus Eisenbacteria bacterium]